MFNFQLKRFKTNVYNTCSFGNADCARMRNNINTLNNDTTCYE